MDTDFKSPTNPGAPAGEPPVAPPAAPAPGAPVPAPAPAAPAPTGFVAPSPAASPMVAGAGAPAKKSKKGLIIGLVIAAVLLIGGGVAAMIILPMIDPENINARLTSELLSRDKYNIGVKVEMPSDGMSSTLDLTVKADIPAARAVIGGTVSTVIEDGPTVALDIATILDKEATYLKVNGISEAINGMMPEGEEVDDMTAMIGGFVGGLLTEVEGKWIRVSGEDFADVPIEEIGGEQATCLMGAVSTFKPASLAFEDALEIYKRLKPFAAGEQLETTADGLTPVKVIANDTAGEYYAEILKARTGVDMNKVMGCMEPVDEEASEDAVTYESISYIRGGLFDMSLAKMEMIGSDGSKITLTFNEPADVNISLPDEYLTIEDLGNIVIEYFKEFLFTMAVEQAKAELVAQGVEITPEIEAMIEAQVGPQVDMMIQQIIEMITSDPSSIIDLPNLL